MKRLFAIRNTETGKLDPETFSSKFRAKQRRDELNAADPSDTGMKWVVTYGPDHHRFSKKET